MAEEGEDGARPGFSGHWLTIQPSLFPEWEREMDRKACVSFFPRTTARDKTFWGLMLDVVRGEFLNNDGRAQMVRTS